MSRAVVALALAVAAGSAGADDAVPPPVPDAIAPAASDHEGDPSDQGIGASVGIATGSHITPGGLRITGHYLYKMSAEDWFDGTASFTFGSSAPECFHDRSGTYVCDHGFVDGRSVELVAAVRRMLAPSGMFRPFARGGVGLGIVRFPDDDVTGVAVSLHLGGGVRGQVAPQVAVVILADLVAGVGAFGHSVGSAAQLGAAILAGAEFRLD